MNAPTVPQPSSRRGEAAPRGRVLLGLGAGVLLAHLSLLSGGMSGLSLDLFAAPDAELSGTAPQPGQPTPPATANADPLPALPEPVRTSRVRWIVPKAPEPEPVPEPPPKVVKKPPPPPPQPEPEPVVEAPIEPAPEAVNVEPVVEPPTEVAMVPPPEPLPEPPAAPQPPVSDLPAGAQAAAGTVRGAGVGVSDASLPPAVAPPSAQLKYDVRGLAKGFNYTAAGRLDWSNNGSTYEATMSVKALFLGSRGQTSVGALNDKGLSPDRFTDRSRSERAAHFERANAKVRYSNNAPDAVLLPGMQDRLSVNFQLAGLFNARPDAYAEGQTLRVPVSTIDMAEVWLFLVGPQTTETLPAGDVVARKLTRSPRREFDRTVEIWLAPSLAHLPVRLRITEQNGDFVDMKLDELPALQPTGTAPTLN
ncbi:DUF3108 domain-containing protein [Hydrogenophaga sp. A37]|uniref:DUF3108 domain-containing protein n=1 Tax=Hydrogenophaga sp. A37 TaxID=1945864 RepID=UPI00098580F5|nr:DUF3108 domain-containing protein [Hydrogenophaga sp. A37]OOG81165.1 hypothetical protein B0E41_18675 [Hydrogenophaga sp. A37]